MSAEQQKNEKGRPKIEEMEIIPIAFDEPVDPQFITQEQYQRALRVATKTGQSVWKTIQELYFPEG